MFRSRISLQEAKRKIKRNRSLKYLSSHRTNFMCTKFILPWLGYFFALPSHMAILPYLSLSLLSWLNSACFSGGRFYSWDHLLRVSSVLTVVVVEDFKCEFWSFANYITSFETDDFPSLQYIERYIYDNMDRWNTILLKISFKQISRYIYDTFWNEINDPILFMDVHKFLDITSSFGFP